MPRLLSLLGRGRRTLTDEELKELRENKARAERDRAEKERQRRAEMSQEAAAVNAAAARTCLHAQGGLLQRS